MTTGEQWRQLESRIAEFFSTHGYVTRCNVVLEGRSGGRHEIDVYAEKADALTTYRVAVECKAWQSPVEKDVVSKLHYVLTDLGLNKGIVVSLGGCRSGAEQAAAALGIDVWGPDELRRHLGEPAVGHLTAAGAPGTLAWGVRPTVPLAAAENTIRTAGKGRFGLRTLEQLVWLSQLWLPVHCVRLTVAQPETRLIKTRLRSTSVTNLYDALSGTFLGPQQGAWEEVRLDHAIALRPLLRDTKVHAALRKAVETYGKVTTDAAKARHAATLARLGLPAPCESVTVDGTWTVYLPYYVGLLQAGGRERAAAVSASTGRLSEPVSEALTTNLSAIRSHFTQQR